MTARPIALVTIALSVPAFLVGCGSSPESGSAATTSVAVTATDTTCTLDASTVPSGPVAFAVTNAGSEVTEVYVYAKSGDAFTTVVSEVENIGPGISRDMTVELAAGTYEVACKPGQTGSGIRATLTAS